MIGTKKLHKQLKRIAIMELKLQAELSKYNNESPMRWDGECHQAIWRLHNSLAVLRRKYGVKDGGFGN